ncbi:DUF3558 family protein [Amycolatopsis sp. NPDC051371]|uniref:DUF3558 family protein n=1 Tax=Amycolatopsis sp. NPDC051371 TaxID=3155800 RepID=UPI003439ED85
MTDEKWYPTTPRRPHDPVKTVLRVLAGLGGCGLLWVLALMAIFAGNPGRPSGTFDTTTPVHTSPAPTESMRPASNGPLMPNTSGDSHMTRTATSGSTAHAASSPSDTPHAVTRFGAAAVVLACAACVSPTRVSYTVLSAGPAEPASSSSVPFGGAPAVTNPLPQTVLDGDPGTEASTPDQVEAAIGVLVSGEREDLPQVGPACAWTNHSTGGAVGVSYDLNTHTGLSSVYANTQPKSVIWRPLPPVQGFPAVAHTGARGQTPPREFCQASIGLADTYAVNISLHLGDSKRGNVDPCGEPLQQICDLVITTLRAKGRP